MTGIFTTTSSSFHFPTVSSLSTSSHHRPRPSSLRASAALATPAVASRTPYEVLRVKETATAVEIKSAYRSLAKRFHPDAGVGNRQDKFIEIHDAYATLSDPESRARYDASTSRRAAFFYRDPSAAYGMRTSRWETDQCW